ncbi:hypothetical protein Tco_1279603 [Tanacetum coccineum]
MFRPVVSNIECGLVVGALGVGLVGWIGGSVPEPFSLSVAEVVQFEMLKFLQHQLFRSLEDWKVSSLQCIQRRFTRREKYYFMPKGIKQSPLENVLLKSAEKYIRFSLKDCTWLKFKFEGDNTPIVIQPPCYSASKDFQDSPDDEEDTRSSHEYLNDVEKEYQAKALLAKSKRFFKKGTQRFNSAKATDQTKCHKCGKEGH